MTRVTSSETLSTHRPLSGGGGHRVERILALSNGVFAIALTLLIIDVVSMGMHVTDVLMAISFWSLSRYADRHGLTDPSIDLDRYPGMLKIYRFSLAWTFMSLAVALANESVAIVLWTLMVMVFAAPARFAHFMFLRSERRTAR